MSLPLACTVVCSVLAAADDPASGRTTRSRDYDLPAGDAADTLPRFAAASGEQIIFLVENVRGERTHAVVGRFAAREALERMLHGSALVVAEDPASGAYFVGRKRPVATVHIVPAGRRD